MFHDDELMTKCPGDGCCDGSRNVQHAKTLQGILNNSNHKNNKKKHLKKEQLEKKKISKFPSDKKQHTIL